MDASQQPGTPAGSSSLVGRLVGFASLLGGSSGRYVLAAIAALALVAGGLGALALHDWQSSISIAATAQCRLADLQAAEGQRDQLQTRLSKVQTAMEAQASRLTADHERRLAEAVAFEKQQAQAACVVDLRALKRLK